MDSIDKKILDLLQDNGRITVKEITQTISLTAPAVSERIKRMEKEGIIEGYTAIVNPKKIGRSVHAIINVSIQPQDRENLLEEGSYYVTAAERDMLRKVCAVFQGHYHTGHEKTMDGIPYITLRALSEYEDAWRIVDLS